MKYDHPNFAKSADILANRSEHNEYDISDAIAEIASSIEAERSNQSESEWREWCNWIEDGDWTGDETIESILDEVDAIMQEADAE